MTAEEYRRYDQDFIVVEAEWERGGRSGRVLLASLQGDRIALALVGFQPITWMSRGYIANGIHAVRRCLVRVFG